jgi:hypothetical protein
LSCRISASNDNKIERIHSKELKKRKLDLSENTANCSSIILQGIYDLGNTANPLSGGQLANWQLGLSTQTEKSNIINPLQ